MLEKGINFEKSNQLSKLKSENYDSRKEIKKLEYELKKVKQELESLKQ